MNKPNKADIYKHAATVGNDAPLQTKPKKEDVKATCRKDIRTMPVAYVEAYEQLKADNKTGLNLTAYILEALREKLERDGAI